VFKHVKGPLPDIVLSEVSGVQLNRQLALAMRIDPQPNPALSLVRELIDSEFLRLSRRGAFSFGAAPGG
jgi:LysR family nitrogen assimilation transcriptional regulator